MKRLRFEQLQRELHRLLPTGFSLQTVKRLFTTLARNISLSNRKQKMAALSRRVIDRAPELTRPSATAPAQGEVFHQSALARLAASIKLSVVFDRIFLR